MLGVLSLGVCIACISCLCCLCTSAVVATPGLIDLRTGLLLCGKRREQDFGHKSEKIFRIDEKKNFSKRNENTSDENDSECCPCAITYVIDPFVQSRKSRETCELSSGKRKYCRCPSFLDLVGDTPDLSGRILPRS